MAPGAGKACVAFILSLFYSHLRQDISLRALGKIILPVPRIKKGMRSLKGISEMNLKSQPSFLQSCETNETVLGKITLQDGSLVAGGLKYNLFQRKGPSSGSVGQGVLLPVAGWADFQKATALGRFSKTWVIAVLSSLQKYTKSAPPSS